MDENVEKIYKLINQRKLNGQIIISIDGPCGGGKTTLANQINKDLDYNILHMDDFYLPFDKRDANWMNIIAGHMDFDRLVEKVLIPYKDRGITNYVSYDCHSDMYLQEIPISLDKILIIEGSYSSHTRLEPFLSLKIFVDIDREEQTKRLTKRNPKVVDKFLSMWVPFENNYFEKLRIKENSDLVVRV